MNKHVRLAHSALLVRSLMGLLFVPAIAQSRPAKHNLTMPIPQHSVSEALQGEYLTGTGYYGTQLRLLANHSFTFETSRDIRDFRNPHNRGSYQVQGENIRLLPQSAVTSTEEWDRLPLQLVPVFWGKRTYLLPAEPKTLLAFCNAVNSGYEPRHRSTGRFYLKSGDENKDVQGQPPLPMQWHAYLLAAPVQATLVRVLNAKRGVLDAGRNRGIRVGMIVWSQKTRPQGYSYQVMDVQDTTATVINLQGEPLSPTFIGQKVSTFDAHRR